MDTFRAHYADICDPAQHPGTAALLRERGLVTFSGIASRPAQAAAAQRLMAIRPHRDAEPDGVTETTDTQGEQEGHRKRLKLPGVSRRRPHGRPQ